MIDPDTDTYTTVMTVHIKRESKIVREGARERERERERDSKNRETAREITAMKPVLTAYIRGVFRGWGMV